DSACSTAAPQQNSSSSVTFPHAIVVPLWSRPCGGRSDPGTRSVGGVQAGENCRDEPLRRSLGGHGERGVEGVQAEGGQLGWRDVVTDLAATCSLVEQILDESVKLPVCGGEMAAFVQRRCDF